VEPVAVGERFEVVDQTKELYVVEHEPRVSPFSKFDDELPRRVKHPLYLGDVVTTDELFWRGPVEVAEELGSLPVRIHGGGRVFDPGLYSDLREHVPACRDLEKTRLRSRRFGQGRGEFEYAGAERVRVGLGRRDPTCPLLQELRKGAYDLESSAGVEAGTETLLPYRQLPLQAGSR
jgi:hypothetical protein